MLWKNAITIFGKEFSFVFRIVDEKTVLTGGFTNRCRNGEYVLFLDHDNTPIEWLEEEIKLLQKYFPDLGNAYVFKTRGGFHTLFLEKFPLMKIVQMMEITSCDYNYKKIPLYHSRRQWVLRSLDKKNEKIEYLGVRRHNSTMERSYAHMDYLRKVYRVPNHDFLVGGEFDDEKDLTLAYYKTSEKNG